MAPLPLRQFEQGSRLVIDAEGQHYCLAGTPALAAQIVAVINQANVNRTDAVLEQRVEGSRRPFGAPVSIRQAPAMRHIRH